MHRPPAEPEWNGQTSELLQEARGGSAEALGRLLEGCRAYLLLIANEDLEPELRAKGGASDLVQETFLQADRDFAQFRGRSGRELLAWLRRVLRHNLADFRARYRDRVSRQVGHERPLDAREAKELRARLTADTPPPEDRAATAELEERLRQALARLPEDYRRAVELHNEQGLSFAEVGAALGRSPGAAQKLWFRAIERLKLELKGRHEPGKAGE